MNNQSSDDSFACSKHQIAYDMLYDNLNKEKIIPRQDINFSLNDCSIKIRLPNSESSFFLTSIDGVSILLLKEPYNIMIKLKNIQKQYKIYSVEQLEKIIKTFDQHDILNFIDKNEKFIRIKGNIVPFLTQQCKQIVESTPIVDKYLQLYTEFTETFLTENKTIKYLSPLLSLYQNKIQLDSFGGLIESQEKTKLINDIVTFMSNEDLCIYICGSYGIGKSTSLMTISSDYFSYFPAIYLNIRTLDLYQMKEDIVKNIFIIEGMKLFNTKQEYYDYVIYILNIKYVTYWNLLLSLIEFLEVKKRKFIIILDQYKEKCDKLYRNLEIIKARLFPTKIKIIISSSVNDKDIRHNLINQWLAQELIESQKYNYYPDLIKMKKNEIVYPSNTFFAKYFKKFGYLPRYYYPLFNINTLKGMMTYYEKTKNQIIKKLLNFYNDDIGTLEISLMEIKNSLNIKLSKIEFERLILEVPLKYFRIYNQKDIFIIKPHFPLIKEVIDDLIEQNYFLLKKHSVFISEQLNLNNSYNGYIFENILHYKFQPLKEPFTNIMIDNIIRFNNFKNFDIVSKVPKIDNNITFLWPTNTNGPYFNSGLLIGKKGDFKLIIFQITINKPKKKMMTKTKIEEKYKVVLKSINKKLKIEVEEDNCYFYYIFSREITKDIDIEFCHKEQIQFFFFSEQNLKFYEKNKGNLKDTVLTKLPLNSKAKLFHCKANSPKQNNEENGELLGNKTERAV